MRLWGWFGKREDSTTGLLKHWRIEWSDAVRSPAPAPVEALRARLDGFGLPEEDIEIEREMLDGLSALVELAATAATAGLPTVETGHRIVGVDVCHFTAPVSAPDDPAQPSGRLLLTSTRAIFVGGVRGTAVPWHAVGQVLDADRDIVLIRADGQSMHRFRCNGFGDALCAAFVARRLAAGAKRRTPGL